MAHLGNRNLRMGRKLQKTSVFFLSLFGFCVCLFSLVGLFDFEKYEQVLLWIKLNGNRYINEKYRFGTYTLNDFISSNIFLFVSVSP